MIEFLDEGSTYVCYCLVQAGRETGPVVKVDDVYRTVGRDDGISAIDVQPQQAGGLGANVLKVTFSERVKHRGSVDEFMTEFVEFAVLGVTPEEKRLASHSIKFYQIACQVFCYNPPFNAPSGKSRPLLSGDIRCRCKTHVVGADSVHVAPFQPTGSHVALLQQFFDGARCLGSETAGVGNVILCQDVGEGVAAAVFDASGRVDNNGTGLLQLSSRSMVDSSRAMWKMYCSSCAWFINSASEYRRTSHRSPSDMRPLVKIQRCRCFPDWKKNGLHDLFRHRCDSWQVDVCE